MKEVWKKINGYDHYYVSNFGNIMSLSKWSKGKNLNLSKIGGYLKVNLYKKGVKTFRVHRLVACAFIENIKDKPQVNHLNGIKSDNNVKNLERCNNSENMKHSYRELSRCRYKGFCSEGFNSKQVGQYKKDGSLIKIRPSLAQAERELNLCRIWRVCVGIRKTAGGYIRKHI